MAQRKPVEASPITLKDFTPEEIARGIVKLRRRIEEVRSLDPQKVSHDDASVGTVQHNIRDTILEIFGERSPEYERHRHHQIWHGAHSMGGGDYQTQKRFANGIPQTIRMLEGLIARLEERQSDANVDPSTRAKVIF